MKAHLFAAIAVACFFITTPALALDRAPVSRHADSSAAASQRPDGSSKSTFPRDDADAAGKFDGQRVPVTRALDAANNAIHMQTIQAAG